MQPVHRERGGGREIVAHTGEVRRDHQAHPARARGQVFVRAGEHGALGVGPVQREAGLVELHPRRPRRAQRGQNLRVHREQRVEQREPVEGRALRLPEQQERDRTDEDRRRLDPQRLRLAVLVHRLGGGEAEGLPRLELGDDVVVVRVEPLRHFHRGDVAALSLTAPRHGEVRDQVDAIALPAVAGRHRADEGAGVEHAVVEGEVVRRNAVNAGIALQLPMTAAQVGAGAEQLLGGDFPAPEPLGGALQLARRAKGRESESG